MTLKPTLHTVCALIVAVAFLFPVTAIAEQKVISGSPSVRIRSASESTSREVLSPEQQSEFGLRISKAGDTYIWKSRENRPLVHTEGGEFHMFIDPLGGGYIKVVDQTILPTGRVGKAPYAYFEFISLGLETITYWGEAESFDP